MSSSTITAPIPNAATASSSAPPRIKPRDKPRKPCKTCGVLNLAFDSPYSNCPKCRKRAREAKAAFLDEIIADRGSSSAPHSEPPRSSSPGPSVAVSIPPEPLQKPPKAKKRKVVTEDNSVAPPTNSKNARQDRAPKPLNDLNGDDQEKARMMMKWRLTSQVRSRQNSPPEISVQHSTPEGTEYQTATNLYDAAKAAALGTYGNSKRTQFHGYHSIIASARINHQSRAVFVVNDLKKIARVPFEYKKPTSTTQLPKGVISVYPCACQGHRTTLRIEEGTNVPRQVSSRVECHGRVFVKVETDDSHPSGIPGQRVVVGIEHGRD